MVQLLLIVTFVALHLAGEFGRVQLLPWPAWALAALILAPIAALAALFAFIANRCGKRMDSQGSARAYFAADTAQSRLRILGTAWYIFGVFGLGWVRIVQGMRRGPAHSHAALGDVSLADAVIIIFPVIALFLSLWWSMFPLERRVREAMLFREIERGNPVHPIPTRGQYVWGQFKHNVLIVALPIMLVKLWDDALNLFASRAAGAWWPTAEPYLRWGGIVLALIAAPALLRFAWDTVRVGESPLTAMVRDMCKRYRVRINGPFLWRTHGAMVNGAVLGVVWPMRYLLLTDALLDRLDADHVEGVLAHEVAHVKKRHLMWLGISVIATVLACGWAATLLAYVQNWDSQSDTVAAIASVIGLLGAVMVFGAVSRRFEWQADAFAAKHMSEVRGSPVVTGFAAGVMTDALQLVADLNGMRTDAFSWRHGSIARRQRNLSGLVGLEVGRLPIDRTVRVIKIVSLVILLAAGIPVLIQAFNS